METQEEKRMQEKEIDIVDLIVEILLQWRKIIVAIILGAVVMGGFSYMQSYRTSKTQAAKVEAAKQQLAQETQQNTEDEMSEKMLTLQHVTREWVEERITDTQMHNVNHVLTYEQLYNDKVAYSNNSILMNMNPNSIYKAEITLHFVSDDIQKTYNIERVYEDVVRSGELIGYIAEELNMTTSNVNEVVGLEKESYSTLEGTDSLRMRVLYSDKETCEKITQIILDYIEEKSNVLMADLGEHKVNILNNSIIMIADTNIMSYQKNYLADISSMEDTIAKYKGNFSEMEWYYYDILVNGEVTGLSVEKVLNKESSAEQDKDSKEESLTDIINKGVTVFPGISIKYVILGVIMAVFICLFVFFLRYILNNKIRVTDNLQYLYLIPQLGVIPQQLNTKRFLGFVDGWILSLRNHNKRKFSEQEAIRLAAVAVKLSAGKEDIDSVCLIGCDIKERSLQVCEQLKATLNKENVEVEILNNVLYDAQAMSDLENAKGVVLVEKAGSTLYTEIAQELALLKRQEIRVLGSIVVE